MAGWPDLWPAWRPHPGAAHNAEDGGWSRERAYDAELTGEAREAFADRGYLADPDARTAPVAELRQREATAGELARNLSGPRAARIWHAAYRGQPGVTEYRVHDLEPEAG